WQETTPDDLATRVKRSMAISKNRFSITRTRKHASNFIHVIGTSSGITPEVRCNGCRMVPRQSEGESRAPNEWDLEFDVSTLALDDEKEFEFSVIFWNAFQNPTQWWGGFRILHPTVLSLYSIQFPETRRPLPDTFQYLYVDSKEHPYNDDVLS